MEVLVAVLKEQVTEYQKLLDLAKEKQQVLIANDIKGLEELTAKEQKLIIAISRLENKRLQVIGALSNTLGADCQTQTLQELAEKSPEPFNQDLSAIYVQLHQITEELGKTNEQNADLINQALKIVNFSLNSLTDTEREVTYPKRDEAKNVPKTSRIFDSKA